MDKELKAKWVKALRSGKYQQGAKYLHQDGKYCCLGVLRDVVGVENVWRAVGNHASKLISMNDGCNDIRKHSFAEIADYIEANL